MSESGLGTAPARVREAATSPATQQQTVFDEATFVPKRSDNSLAVNSTTDKIQRASIRFFIVTGLSLIEAMFFSLSDVKVAVACGVVAVVFGVLGALMYRLNKGAVLIGMLLYIAETALLLVHGWNTAMVMVAYGVFVHCAIIYRLYLSYGMIGDLQTA